LAKYLIKSSLLFIPVLIIAGTLANIILRNLIKILILINFVCPFGCSNDKQEPPVDKYEFIPNSEFDYYQDYNIFSGKFINKTNRPDTLPCFIEKIFENDDSTVLIPYSHAIGTQKEGRHYKGDRICIYKNNRLMYGFHNIKDGPRYYFSLLNDTAIIRLIYEDLERNQPDFQEKLPDIVEVIVSDTIFEFNADCFDSIHFSNSKLIYSSDLVDISHCSLNPYIGGIYLDFSCTSSEKKYPDGKDGLLSIRNSTEDKNPEPIGYGYCNGFNYWRWYQDPISLR